MGQYARLKREHKKEMCLRILGGKSCSRCGANDLPPACYDFHHNKGGKTSEISKLISGCAPMKQIEEELKKCVVLCANCHRFTHSVKVS